MIIFKSLRYKNFLSTGNTFNTIELNSHTSTAIIGKNGAGKSTFLCALTFALFGKAFRNINKGQLINSINGKDCVVEVDFEIQGNSYLVRRGMKPNIFEIWCNDDLIKSEAATKDYQRFLEQQILKLNFKTFTQVVILGSATFIPFMQLPLQQRREVIEDILDIRIFTLMNSLLKEKAAKLKDQLLTIDSEIESFKFRIEAQKKIINSLGQSKNTMIETLTEQINTNTQKIKELTVKQSEIQLSLNEIVEHSTSTEAAELDLKKSNNIKTRQTTKIETLQKEYDFFKTSTSCITCKQDIQPEHTEHILTELEVKMRAEEEMLEIANKAIITLQSKLEDIKIHIKNMNDLNIELFSCNSQINYLMEQNEKYQKDILKYNESDGDVTIEKNKMKEYADEAIRLVNLKKKLDNDKTIHSITAMLLKDSGVKTAIIREYLPAINKLINKYLSTMDFFVKFEFDESFNESIKSRHRDEFTYASFSEGEKRRIDLAILFAWRQIAKMKNSVNTNLMILDEILDGSLDALGIDYFLSMMDYFGENTNIFVISHREVVERFDRVLRVEKKNEFSVMVEHV